MSYDAYQFDLSEEKKEKVRFIILKINLILKNLLEVDNLILISFIFLSFFDMKFLSSQRKGNEGN